MDPGPELLGRVFENLYQGDERHDSGTYYTPLEIVHFMCREALDGYLRDVTGVDRQMWLLPVLNSTIFEFVLCHLTNNLRGGYLRLIHQYVSQLPIVTPDKAWFL